MDDQEQNVADDSVEMNTERISNPGEELRKRRSTRIVQAVPLVVTGVDALGRPFTERTSTLIINCHGCRYQSKHYVLKNMWVNLEVPHPEPGQPPRTVRGKVAWIQRPRTVRQLFQVALELEVAGNAWGIAFPPEDWFAFPDEGAQAAALTPAGMLSGVLPPAIGDAGVPLGELDAAAGHGAADNVRVFPAPTSTTDASMQLARQVARLLAEAKQQIQNAVQESAAQAVSSEHARTLEQFDQKYAAFRQELARETKEAISSLHEESEKTAKASQTAAIENLQNELPRWLAPQLEQLTQQLTAQLSREAEAHREEHERRLREAEESLKRAKEEAEAASQRLLEHANTLKGEAPQWFGPHVERLTSEFTSKLQETGTAQRSELDRHLTALQEMLQTLCGQAEEAAQKLRTQSETTETHLTGKLAEIQQKAEATHSGQQQALDAAMDKVQSQITAAIEDARNSLRVQVSQEIEVALQKWHSTVEGSLNSLLSQTQEMEGRLNETGARHLAALNQPLEERKQQLEDALHRATDVTGRLDQHSQHLDTVQRQALDGFQSQLEDVLNIHRNELHRSSDAMFEEINARIRSSFDAANTEALERFEQQIESLVSPHVTKAEEAMHRLAGGRSLLDAAMTMQQDRVRATADEAFAESLAKFRENLGSVEQVLNNSAQTITARNLDDLEGRTADLKHKVLEEMAKSAEWYEKKAQTQIHNATERLAEQAGNQLREKAAEVSSLFAGELNHASRGFVGHTQQQLEESVREAFEKARMLFAEAADTTSAAFTDEIQRNALQELDGFNELSRQAVETSRRSLDEARQEISQKTTREQEEFLRRFHEAMSGTLEKSVNEAQQAVGEGFEKLLASWREMNAAKEKELLDKVSQTGDESAQRYRDRLENISNSWLVATVATLDHQSKDVLNKVTASAEERLRQASSEVVSRFADSLRERLQQIAAGISTLNIPKD